MSRKETIVTAPSRLLTGATKFWQERQKCRSNKVRIIDNFANPPVDEIVEIGQEQ